MDRKEMLRRMDLSEGEFKDLVAKFKHFHDSLNRKQKAVLNASLPTLERAAKSFGPDVTGDQLRSICGSDATVVTFVSNVLNQNPNNPNPNDQ